MNQAEVFLSGVEYKVKLLIQKNKALSERLGLLEERLKETEGVNEKLKNEVSVLEEKVKTLRVSQVLMTENDKSNVHERIDELVREIDKSINIFNRLE
ncbi:MAG: hypothetical protein CSA94_01240 [Bacteroidetes bacterium]|nr:MAG: hypothetical protein CSA94_01240 [Bacteroidota bacterium]